MAPAFTYHFASRLLRTSVSRFLTPRTTRIPPSVTSVGLGFQSHQTPLEPFSTPGLRYLATLRRQPSRPRKVDIGARARRLQNRRLWTYALTFSGVAAFIVIVIYNFEDQMVFYVTPSDALEKFSANPSKTKFRLGGLVLEGSVVHPPSSSEMEFVITDLITDILVKYEGPLPDLFREGHSAVVEGHIRPFTPEDKQVELSGRARVSEKARTGDYYFAGTEVLAKHDEKYMPKEVAAALERNKAKLEEAHSAQLTQQQVARTN
ncbi:hypothetical protein AMTRI_Chr03g139420 [Amborella trichopoda]